MAKKKTRPAIALHCKECNRFNYTLFKKAKAEYKLDDLMKYCNQCRKHQPHVEKRIPKPQPK